MNNKYIGDIGEDIACKYISQKDFIVTDRNFRKKWGEIDIVATKEFVVHFFEVKSTSDYKFFSETNLIRSIRPEEKVDFIKVSHIRRMIETYFYENNLDINTEFQFHVLCVYIDFRNKNSKIKWLKNIIL